MDTATVRAALKWAVTDRLSITPSILFQRLYLNDTAAYWPSLSDPGSEVFLNGNAQANPSTDPFYLAAIKASWDLDSVRLANNVSYFSRSQYSVSDYTQFDRTAYLLIPTYGPLPPAGDYGSAYFEDHQNNFYEELRAESRDADARLAWTAGLFYSRLDENSVENVFDPTLNAEYNAYYTTNPNPYFPPPPFCTSIAPCPNGQILNQPSLRVIDTQLAGYGEVSFKIIDTLKLTTGLRVARTSYSADGLFYGPFISPVTGPSTPIIFSGSHTETPVTPKFVLGYQPERDTLVYASAAKGFRVGGLNTTLGSVCAYDLSTIGLTDAPNQYRSDSLWSYELGTKLTLDERRLQINASVYLIDWSNIQQNVYLPTCALTYVANLGRARSEGGDLQVQYRPVNDLLLDLTVAHTDAKYTQTVCGSTLVTCTGAGALTAPVVSAGDRLRGAPWTVLFGGEYGLTVGQTRPYLRVDYTLTSAQNARLPGQDPANALTDLTIPGLPQTRDLALRAGVRVGGLDVSLFAQNVTDQHPVLFSARDSLASDLYFERSVRPRTFGVTANYRY
jgi:outer membrane receptor protein involved in Fe transport